MVVSSASLCVFAEALLIPRRRRARRRSRSNVCYNCCGGGLFSRRLSSRPSPELHSSLPVTLKSLSPSPSLRLPPPPHTPHWRPSGSLFTARLLISSPSPRLSLSIPSASPRRPSALSGGVYRIDKWARRRPGVAEDE